MNRPVDRIKQLAQWYKAKGVISSINMFEEVCGFSKNYIKNLHETKIGNPSVDVIAKIYKTFSGVSLHWLVLGEGDMFTVSELEVISAGNQAVKDCVKSKKVRKLLNNKVLNGMTREEKLELIEKLL